MYIEKEMMVSNGDLPEELVTQILLRLSVKSLIRFRCVCRSWCALVKNPRFIFRHFNNNHDDNSHLIAYFRDANSEDRRDVLSLFLDQTLVDLSYQDLYSQLPTQLGQLMGSYNGLFCIYNRNYITLWNVATRESRTLPKCKAVFPRDTTVYICNVGIEFYPDRDDYKLVLLRTLWDDRMLFFHDFTHVAIYTQSTDSWRNFQGDGFIPYILHERYDSIYLNGVFYWLALQNTYDQVILAFHMNKDKFHEIQGPHIVPSAEYSILGLYRECLSFLFFDSNESCYDIWVMKERCWTKQMTVGPILGVFGSLGFWQNGAFFILSSTTQLLLYDPNTDELKDLGLKTIGIEIHIYRESLITIKKGDDLLEFFDIPWYVLGVDSDSS